MTSSPTLDALMPLLERIATALERAAPPVPPPFDPDAADAFLWGPERRLVPVPQVAHVAMALLTGIDRARDTLVENTERVAVGNSILLLPLYPPAIVAKMMADLDHASGGRIRLGVGIGGEYPAEFSACQVPMKERGRRTDEAIPLLRKLWTGEEITHDGRYYPMEGVRILPAPVQPGGPPIYVSGRSEAAMRRAAASRKCPDPQAGSMTVTVSSPAAASSDDPTASASRRSSTAWTPASTPSSSTPRAGSRTRPG